MDSRKFNNFLKNSQTNWKYILIILILAVLVGGGILGYLWQTGKKETKVPEVQVPSKVITPEEVATKFFQWYLTEGSTAKIAERTDVTEEYKKKIAEILKIPGPGMVNPVIFAQDFPDRGFRIEKTTITDKIAYVTVILTWSGSGDTKRECELLLVDDQWKINNISLFLKIYTNKDFGFAFSYPKDWQVINESKYQRTACYDPEYRKKDPTCGKHPLVNLGKEDKILLSINLRQCLNEIELLGGHFICFDPALPPDKRGTFLDTTGERMKYLDAEVQYAITDIKHSFQILE